MAKRRFVPPVTLVERTQGFRERYRLSTTEFLDLLKRFGVPTANPVTLNRWERGKAQPSVATEEMWSRGMEEVRTRLDSALRGRLEPQDSILRVVVARLQGGEEPHRVATRRTAKTKR